MTAATLQHSNTPASQYFLDDAAARTCIHCGLCLSSCPTYLETGNENDSPRGRIYLMRALQEGKLALDDAPVRHIDLCLGCRACEAVCPSGVQYGELLEHTRDHIEKHYTRSPFQSFLRRIAIEQVFPFPWRTKLALAPVKILRAIGLEKIMPKFIRDSMALVPQKCNSTPLPELSPADSTIRQFNDSTTSPKVGFVSGCVQSVFFGDTNANSVNLLNRAGYDVVTPRDQGCCGALYAHSGNLDAARECARHNIEVFEKSNVDKIIINAAGCGSTLKEYDKLLADDPSWAARAKEFSAKIKDLVEVITPGVLSTAAQKSEIRNPKSETNSKIQTPEFEIQNSIFGFKVTYHDACHLCHAQRISKPPRELIKAIAGKNFVELPESDVCCGSAGSYNLTEPEMAERLQQRKIQNILATGAQIVVTTNPGCLLQIRAGLKKAAPQVRVVHIADFLTENGGCAAKDTAV